MRLKEAHSASEGQQGCDGRQFHLAPTKESREAPSRNGMILMASGRVFPHDDCFDGPGEWSGQSNVVSIESDGFSGLQLRYEELPN